MEDGRKQYDIISAESTSVITSGIVEFNPMDPFYRFHQCLSVGGKTMLFDEYFHLLLKEKDVKSYEYDEKLNYFIVIHSDNTKSIVPSKRMKKQVREKMEGLFGTYSLEHIVMY